MTDLKDEHLSLFHHRNATQNTVAEAVEQATAALAPATAATTRERGSADENARERASAGRRVLGAPEQRQEELNRRIALSKVGFMTVDLASV